MFDIDKRYFIYGAGDVAREVLYCLRGEPRNLKIEALMVSDAHVEKGTEIDGIPVISFDDLEDSKDVPIIVAVLEQYRDAICTKLNRAGIQNPILMTFESDYGVRSVENHMPYIGRSLRNNLICCCRMEWAMGKRKRAIVNWGWAGKSL